MIHPKSRHPSRPSANSGPYREVFIGRVHQLLELGYSGMDRTGCRYDEETAITGKLVEAMDKVLDDPKSEPWTRYFSVHDDPAVNAPGKLGKSRKRIDIRVDSSLQRPRSRFAFEAKRLGNGHPVGDYLGPEGLGCFLQGHYAREDDDGGMLGYVQTGTVKDWSDKLRARLTKSGNGLGICDGHDWQPRKLKGGPKHTYHTRHHRPSLKRTIEIYHTLLAFC